MENSTSNSNDWVWKHYCGASVIGSRFLLTAAQCINYILSVANGDDYSRASALVATNGLLTEGRRLNIHLIEQHPSYCSIDPEKSTKHDYGVILVS